MITLLLWRLHDSAIRKGIEMGKQELIASVAKKSEMQKKEVARVLDVFLETIQEALAGGEEVHLVGFGVFKVKERKARTGRNPATGAEIQIPPAKVPFFKAGKNLRTFVAG